MLARYSDEISGGCRFEIRKYIDGKLAKGRGTLPFGSSLLIEVLISRRLGDGGIVLRLQSDGGADRDIPMDFIMTDGGVDSYRLEITPEKGLYYWELLVLRGYDTLFTSSVNNEDFGLTKQSGRRFRLLCYEDRHDKNEWFCGSTMYQIFPDRFYKGSVPVPIRGDAILNEDWENGVPQYAEKPGGDVKNNVFFGGTLWGVAEKLDFIKSLGADVIYLNPIFEAYSNHKYDTADYETVDAMLGGEAALSHLLAETKKRGMRLILDGVFNHTGSDSRYFNKEGRYPTVGAYNSKESPYYTWYKFGAHPDEYESWWGIKILPRLDHTAESCMEYFTDEGGIGEKYIKMGIGGWRLDVADELSDEFLDSFSYRVRRASKGEALIIGEVWENAADKMAYGKRRRYFTDGQLDSVMNYPFRTAIIDFCQWGDAEGLYNTLVELYSSYPRGVCHRLMNIIGTHDTERIITRLGINVGGCADPEWMSSSERAEFRLPRKNYEKAKKLLKLASTLQYTIYGVPSLYSGDEAGLEGYTDPFCRMPYPWGREDGELMEHYRSLGSLRRLERVFEKGDFSAFLPADGVIGYFREDGGERVLVLASRNGEDVEIALDGEYRDLMNGEIYRDSVRLEPDRALVLKKDK